MLNQLFSKIKFYRLVIFFSMLILLTGIAAAYAEQNTGATIERKFNFGVVTLTHPLVIYRQYLPFVDFISKHLPWDFDLVLYKEYAEVEDAIKNGELDMALLGGISYVNLLEHTALQPIVTVRSSDGSSKTYSIILTKSDNDAINNISDLKGKSMAFGPVQSTSSFVIPKHFLKLNGIGLEDFIAYSNLGTHDAVARAVLRGDYDAGAIGEAFAQRFLGQGLKIVAETKVFPSFIIVAGLDIPHNISHALKDLLLSINADGTEFKSESVDWPVILRNGFAPVTENDYEIFRHLSDYPSSSQTSP